MKNTPRESIESIFTRIQSTLDKFGLPSVFELLNGPLIREAWKCTLNHKINDMVQKAGSLKASHHIWSRVRNIHDSRRAQIKCKLLTGTYILQVNRAAFNQYAVNPTCKLCNTAETKTAFCGGVCFL